MSEIYRIGNHQFESKEEYDLASKDYDNIKRFMKELDIKQPEVARGLYEKLEQSKSLMKTPIGEAFKDKLVKIFVSSEVEAAKQKLETRGQNRVILYFKRIASTKAMLIYLIGFLSSSLLSILTIGMRVCKQVIVEDSNSMIDQIVIPLLQSNRWMLTIVILYSVILLSIFLIQLLQKKKTIIQNMNWLLITGTILLAQLYIVTMI